MLEDEPQLGLRRRQALAGADEERHAGPAPVLDLEPQRGVRLGRRVRRRRRRSRGSRRTGRARSAPGRASTTERKSATCASLIVAGSPREGASIARRGDDLHQVVDDDVAERADRVVEVAAVLDAEVLGHRDLDARDVVPVPDRLEHRCSRTGGRGSPRGPSSRGSGRSGRAATRRWTGAARRRARGPSARSWPNGFSTTTRAFFVSPASARPATTRPNRNGGISR